MIINKKLNLFLIENKKNLNNKNLNNKLKLNINYIKYLNLINFKELKALNSLLRCIVLVNKIKKTVLVYNNNFISILYRSNFYNRLITYKFNNTELDYIYKIFSFTNVSVFVNASSKYVKFKTEHERNIDFSLDCFHNNMPRNPAHYLVGKMYVLVMYYLI
uniref:Ymf73 n=1 Tax=Tetrahymena rostrata TaxID=5909 RepID=UPI002079466B|nr:Ymf73 [Tetrahymena rostrata]URP31148.1 Ymf73 [Tetrahymena rostrata]